MNLDYSDREISVLFGNWSKTVPSSRTELVAYAASFGLTGTGTASAGIRHLCGSLALG
jgi:hypothetical protein